MESRSKNSACQQNMFPPKPLRQDVFLIFFPQIMLISGLPWPFTHHSGFCLCLPMAIFALCLHLHMTLSSLCGSWCPSFFFICTPIFSIRAQPNEIILIGLCLQLPYFQIMSHSPSLGVRFSTHIFREHYSAHTRDPMKTSDLMFTGQQSHLWCLLLLSIWCNLNLTPSGNWLEKTGESILTWWTLQNSLWPSATLLTKTLLIIESITQKNKIRINVNTSFSKCNVYILWQYPLFRVY